MMNVKLIFFICLSVLFVQCALAKVLDHRYGVDIIFNKDWKLSSADVFVSKNIYFVILSDNGKSLLKSINFTSVKTGEMLDVLQYPVQSAESVAVDWLNSNLYWADKTNRFIEVVDLSHGLHTPISRHRRRILFTRAMADIHSLVVDPSEQYLFWLQIGADMVLERARLDGSERRVIYRSSQYKSSSLAIDRHRKMLFWWGMEGKVHRVDYQGQTRCSMVLKGEWKYLSPSFLTFTDGKLIFIYEDRLWATTFTCGPGPAAELLNTDQSIVPTAIVATKHQLLISGENRTSPCEKHKCSSICLPISEIHPHLHQNHQQLFRCTCSTGIDLDNHYTMNRNRAKCPLFPLRSLIVASHPQIYQVSLDTKDRHLEPLFENAGIPFRLAYDSVSSSLLYSDYNSSSIFSFPLNGYGHATPERLRLDLPIFSRIPASFAVDDVSRNIYWMNDRSSEVWVARISSFNRLKYAALLLSWLPNSGTKDHFSSIPSRRRQSQQPGELAVDSVNRFLFVTIIGDSTASIERYWLDGSHKFNVIKSPNIISPLGLALDHKGHQLFFVDSARDEMIAIDYQGTDKRVITRTFPDFFGLTYNDGFIYWTDIENLSVNVIKTDGSKRSVLTTTHYLKAPTMPVIVVSRTDQSSTHTTSNGRPDIADGNNYLLNYAPCRDGFNNKCDQLCFPTRHNDQSYSCGCSNPAHVLLNSSRCSRSSKMFVYYNQSTMITHQLSSSSPGNDEVSGSSRVVIALGKKKKAAASNSDHNLVDILALQLDHFRNHAYWIDGITNCIMKTSTSSYSLNEWQILCLVSEKITNIGLDIVRNNLYVTITSSFWSRIILIRLPFPNSEVSWRKLIISAQTKNKVMGAVAVHSALKHIFWFETEAEDRLNITEVYQANLDGTDVTLIWRGVADINEIAVDDHANQVWWKNSDKGIIYKHDIVSKELEKLQLSWDILKKRHPHSKDWLHIYPMMHSLYIYLHDSIFYIDSTDLRSVISYNRLKLILYISNESVPIKGFSFVYRSTSASMKKVALAKIDPNAGSIIMCPKSKTDTFIQCSQFCLPTSFGECGCGSIFSLSSDGSTCTDSSDFLMVMTTSGEIINIKVNSAGSGGGSNEKEDIQLIEMMDFPEQKPVRGKTFIDAVYWMSRNVILRLDNNGYLSGVDHTRSFLKIKNYKQLTIQQEKGGNTTFFSLNSYERIYKYFLNRDDSNANNFKRHHGHYHDDHNSNHGHYENWHRYSLAIDPITDTLLWSDWVTGFIAAERLNMERNRIEFLGLILDFRHSSRRPLQIAIAPISSSLIWISADFHAQFPSTAQSSSFRLNGSSMWRQFWIEMSDLDGSRRSVLVKDPGIPACFTVDIHSGRIYWIDMRTNRLMFLYVQWDTFLIRSRHIFGHNMKVTVGSVLATRSSSLLSMVVLKKHLFWIDPLQQVIASTSVNPGFFYKTLSDKVGLTDRTQAASHSLPFLQHKLSSIVRMMARVSQEIFKTMSIGILLKNHPCSHITHSSSSSSSSLSNQNQPCSHLCLSTLPIGLAEGYSYLMTRQHLAGKFRCSCPVSMVMTSTNKLGVCLKSQFVKCDKHEIVCRAGLVFLGPEGMSATNCLPLHHQCDMTEDCLDGSDEVGCNSCNVTHSYSCSGSGICLSLSKRCDGVVDCESDEQCCGDQKFECLSGVDSRRCLSVTDRCNGIRDCIDGSDEQKCHSSDIGLKNDRSSGSEEQVLLGNLSNNHTVAIIAGTVAITACSIAVVYICVTRRKRHKTVHESCLFRANNVNIMFMSQPRRNSRSHRFSRPPYQRPPGSMESLHHAKSCDIIDTLKQQYDETDPASQSLTSLSDCYRRIKNPYPSACSALGRPLFSAHDDIFFQLSRIRKRQVLDASNASNEKLEKLPPSIATVNSAEDIDKIEDDLDNHPMVSHNSLASSSRCESELEEIYVHRYQAMRSPSVLYNYPSSVLQNLLSACNQTSQLYSSQTTVSRDYIFENIYRRRRRKLFKRRMKHKPTKPNESVSPSASPGLNLFSNESQLNIDSSSNLNISPPPPSPITTLST